MLDSLNPWCTLVVAEALFLPAIVWVLPESILIASVAISSLGSWNTSPLSSESETFFQRKSSSAEVASEGTSVVDVSIAVVSLRVVFTSGLINGWSLVSRVVVLGIANAHLHLAIVWVISKELVAAEVTVFEVVLAVGGEVES